VPPGGGLGGGSSDAAAVLRWAGQGRPEAAIRLGSDVPFCVRGGRARVRGAGEIVEPLPYQPLVFTLVLLPFSVSTAAVYRAFDEVGPSPGSNALEKAAFVVEPRIEMVARFLSSIVGVPPTLAGSGSTLFFDGPVEALGLPDSLKVEGIRVSVVEVHSIPAFPLD
jgi:4-diphosphocytidyl-2-C-methyl-D-erythritol kinase